jgi:hypothetical protein
MSVVTPTTNYYKYTTTDGKNYIIKEVVENDIKKYSKAEVIGEFGNKTFKENNEIIKFAKDTEENDMSLPENLKIDDVTDDFVVEEVEQNDEVLPLSTGGRRRRSKSSKKRVKKSRKGGKAKKSKKVRKH